MSGAEGLTSATTLPSAGVIVAGVVGAVAVVIALALLMRRRPDAFPLLAILTLPFRVPIAASGRTVNLLIPLYLVVAAGTLSHLVPRVLGRARKGPREHESSLRELSGWASPRGLEWLLLAAVVLYTLQASYSTDPGKAAENIVFFYLPFGLLFLLLRDVRWTRELVLACLGVAVALAIVLAGVGFVEYDRKALFLNPKVVAANQYDNYFRVNSVFFDPSIYGRFLALVMILVTSVVLWSRRRRDVLLGAATLAWLLAGLVTSFSESSIAALLVGMAVLAAFRWDARATVYTAIALLAIAAVVLVAAPPSLHFGLKGSGGSTNNATSGRTNLVSGGLALFAERPLGGYGSGSFETEYKRHNISSTAENATSASHTIPVTVAAEQGVIGLALYLALLVVALLVLFRGAARAPPRIAIAACFAALVLHTWTYADFLEDPFTWTLLGIGVAFARGRRTTSGTRSARPPPGISSAPARSVCETSSMLDYLKRLVTTGAAYQFGDIVAKGLALVTLPLYTRHLGPSSYGAAETLLTAVILSSIFLRLGVGEAFIRFYFDDDDRARRQRIARTATATVAWTTTVAALLVVAFAGPVSRILLGVHDPTLIYCAALGLWAFTNLEMAYAQLRVDERTRTYVYASGANVAMTVTFTVALVVFANEGARGLLLGNFGASALVVLGLWWTLRRRFSLRVRVADLSAMLRFGLPTVPADASVYALQVADRFYLFRAYSHTSAGLYAVAIKLAAVVLVAVRGFQYAWPPLAYSIDSDEEAASLYSLVTTYYALATGVVVCGVALLARWMVRLLAAGEFFGAYRALPWLALGWALYGLFLVFVVIAGRARVTSRNFPAAAVGLAVNVTLLLLLVPASGAGLGIAGAGIALCGAYVGMLGVMYVLTRGLFKVGFEWARLGKLLAILAGVAVSGELLLPASGLAGLTLRVGWLALVPALLLLTHFFHPHERAQAKALVVDGRRRVRAFRAGHGDVEEYADDPLKDV